MNYIIRCLFFFIASSVCFAEKKVLICGAGGFIGSHLVEQYKREGYWVRGVDIKLPEFKKTHADEFMILDLRYSENCNRALQLKDLSETFDEVCHLAADMGGMGFISCNDSQIMHNSSLITLNLLEACKKYKAKKILYTSSACVYPEHNQKSSEHPICKEDTVYPAFPDTEYGWEKLYGERVCKAYSKDHKMDVRIVRLHNVYGPYGTWKGGREKAPAALCRKIAEMNNSGTIEVWGSGQQTRSFLYIDECIIGIRKIMDFPENPPILNLGSAEMISINDLVQLIAKISGKNIHIKNIPGPEGVKGRNSDNNLINETLGWSPSQSLSFGLEKLYCWIEDQVRAECEN